MSRNNTIKELVGLVNEMLKSFPDSIPPQALLSAQLQVELTLIESGYDRPENFSLAVHWCKKLNDDYGLNFQKTLETVLDDAKKCGYTIDEMKTPNLY